MIYPPCLSFKCRPRGPLHPAAENSNFKLPKRDSPSSFRLKPEMLSLLIQRLSLKIAKEEREKDDRQSGTPACATSDALSTYEEVYFRRPLHLNVI